MINAVLNNESGSALDIVVLNAGAAIYVAGLTETLEAGITRAAEVIADGQAKAVFQQLIVFPRNT